MAIINWQIESIKQQKSKKEGGGGRKGEGKGDKKWEEIAKEMEKKAYVGKVHWHS